MTLIGTSVNLIVAGLVTQALASGDLHGMQPLGLFAPTRVGVPVTVAGLLFMIWIGTRLLPGERRPESGPVRRRSYRVEFRVESNSDLDGQTLEEAGFAHPTGYELLAISRKGADLPISPDLRLQGGDRLAMAGPVDGLAGLWTVIGLLPAYGNLLPAERYRNQLVELVVSPELLGVGRLVSDLPLPDSPYRVCVVGVSHDGHAPAGALGDYRVRPGDAAIVEVDDAFFYENRRESDFVLIKGIEGHQVQRVDRAVVAVVITVAMMALTAFNVMTMLNAALLATGVMLMTGCLTIRRTWESLDLRTVVGLAAAVGLESALTGSGLSTAIADVLSSFGGRSPTMALAVVFFAAVLMSNAISHAASAVFMFPVALSIANKLGVSFMPFAIILMMGASCAFINPAGFQTNLMVQEPGGYSFGDFVKVGLPLTVVMAVVVLLIAPLVYGF